MGCNTDVCDSCGVAKNAVVGCPYVLAATPSGNIASKPGTRALMPHREEAPAVAACSPSHQPVRLAQGAWWEKVTQGTPQDATEQDLSQARTRRRRLRSAHMTATDGDVATGRQHLARPSIAGERGATRASAQRRVPLAGLAPRLETAPTVTGQP
eukprot:scaffold360_cov334-Prasinococcus_capsulatus_cf.AAC.14